MVSAGSLTRDKVENARRRLAEIFDVPAEKTTEISFSASGEDGVQINLSTLGIGGLEGDRKWVLEKTLKKVWADVSCVVLPRGRLQGIIVRKGDMQGAIQAIGDIGEQETNDLKRAISTICTIQSRVAAR